MSSRIDYRMETRTDGRTEEQRKHDYTLKIELRNMIDEKKNNIGIVKCEHETGQKPKYDLVCLTAVDVDGYYLLGHTAFEKDGLVKTEARSYPLGGLKQYMFFPLSDLKNLKPPTTHRLKIENKKKQIFDEPLKDYFKRAIAPNLLIDQESLQYMVENNPERVIDLNTQHLPSEKMTLKVLRRE